MINIVIWLVVGGLIGWLGSLIMRTDAQQGLLLNIVVGIVLVVAVWLDRLYRTRTLKGGAA